MVYIKINSDTRSCSRFSSGEGTLATEESKKRPLSRQAARAAATVVKKWVKNESGLQLTFNENASECVAMQKGSRSSRFEGNRSQPAGLPVIVTNIILV